MKTHPIDLGTYQQLVQARAGQAELAIAAARSPEEVRRIVLEHQEALAPFAAEAARLVALQPPAPIVVPTKPDDAQLVEAATQAAIDAGCKVIQDALGVTSGDVGGIAFSGEAAREAFAERFRTYLALERLYADDE